MSKLAYKNLKVSIIFCLFSTFLLSSCQNNKDVILKKITGDWAMDKVTYDGNDNLSKLYANTLFFEENNSIVLPQTFDYDEEKAFWNITKDGDDIFLEIKSINPIFKGKYVVKFIKNYEKKLLGIDLESNKTHIIAYKFLQNFEVDGHWW